MSKFKPSQRGNVAEPLPSRAPARLLRPALASVSVAEIPLPAAPPPEAQQQASPSLTSAPLPSVIQRAGFDILLVYLFFRFSFLHEFIADKLGVDLHIIFTLSTLCYLCVLLSGRIAEAFRHKLTWIWIAFAAWLCLATATSFWRGGSFGILTAYLRTALPIVVIIPALISSKKDISRVIGTIGLACAATILLGLLNQDFRTGRMSINQANSEIQDSNDFAAHLILMLPALAYLLLRPGRSVLLKIAGTGLLAAALFEILSTGSRGGLLSLSLTALYLVCIAGNKLRMGLLVSIPVLALVAIPFIPRESAARLQTLFSGSSNTTSSEATESSQARLALLQESWRISLEHPLTGIGPGEFMDAQAQNAQENGQRGLWHVTHNSYTQVSSECGLPALLLYLAAIASTFRKLWRGKKLSGSELALPAAVLGVMLVGYAVCIFFLSQAYSIHFLVLGGLALALTTLSRRQDGQQTAAW